MKLVGTLLVIFGASVAWLLGVQGYSSDQAISHVAELFGLGAGTAPTPMRGKAS